MSRILILALPLLLSACFGQDTPPAAEFPFLPDLPASVVQSCPAAELLTGDLGDLAQKDAALAVEYAKCRAGKDVAVDAYQDAQKQMRAVSIKAKTPHPR
jgi:hypothetical protein